MGDQASWESDLKRRLRNYKDEMGERFIWVLHVAKEPNYALKNSESADGVDRSQFIRDGLAWMHARPVSKREEEEEG